jgi:hypothetical protein
MTWGPASRKYIDMLKAIREAGSGSGGKISSKRVTLFALLALFAATIIVNLVDNKNILNPIIETHLYLSLSTALAAVFAERWVNKKADIKPPDGPAPPGGQS